MTINILNNLTPKGFIALVNEGTTFWINVKNIVNITIDQDNKSVNIVTTSGQIEATPEDLDRFVKYMSNVINNAI